ncbi:MAG: type I restriction-modification system subunit M [Rhodanobacter sp.]
MALKKSQLYSSLWQSCDELRGGMDASQYKDYVLTLLFMKYVSDKYAGKHGAVIEVSAGGSFADMIKLKGHKEIGDRINKIIAKLAEANDLQGVIDQANFNDEDKLGKGKDMQDRLSKLVAIFEGLDFRANRAEGDDLLGDAYEYLMRHFATESGKSKGQFYTPAEVSRIMAKVIGIERAASMREPTAYDPTCGSGSLLIKAVDEAHTGKIAIYGQEMDNATWALARMNMILHGHPTAELWKDNTLSSPHFVDRHGRLKAFDFAVANPPFSTKSWANGFNPHDDTFHRFEDGVPPEKNGDYAFLLHLIASLKSTGKGAIILPHGVLFRGNAEAQIRRQLIRRGYLKGIIGLPANLFYGTGIPACILVIDKEHAQARRGIFMLDASAGYLKDGPKNRLREQDIHRIVDVFTRQDASDPRYARMVGVAEIERNDFNLNLPRYIDSQLPEDRQDIDAHLNGGIPVADVDALKSYWAVCPKLRTALFKPNRPGYMDLAVDKAALKSAIYEHPQFSAFIDGMNTHFQTWRDAEAVRLKALKPGFQPKALIAATAERLLGHYRNRALVDPYAVYQHLMDYWAHTLQDDAYLVATDGWKAEPYRIIEKDKKSKEKDKGWACDLVPKALIVARYYAAEQAAIDQLAAEFDAVDAQLNELQEEHGGEDAAFSGYDKINAKAVKERMDEISHDIPAPSFPRKRESSDSAATDDAQGELVVLKRWLKLDKQRAALKKSLKEAETALDDAALAHYPKLTQADIKTLVVDDKWLAALETVIHGELGRVSQQLTTRVKELAERYGTPLPKLAANVDALQAKVDAHLKRMGFAWK